jgi:hypothetical protein
MYNVYIPTGYPEIMKATIDHIPEGCTVDWSPSNYTDGHREGTLYTNTHCHDYFAIEEVMT